MDVCHCMGEWNGMIGAISVKSSNNVIQQATCIAPKETADAYEHLIDFACKNEEVGAFLNKPTTTIITDKHKGSESAVPTCLSESEHLRCGEHMLGNAGPTGPEGRMASYEAARAPDKATCEAYIDKAFNPAAGKEKGPLEFFQDVVMQTGAKLASQGEIYKNNPDAVHTLFAVSKFNAKMGWSKT
eukprot:g11472.t1